MLKNKNILKCTFKYLLFSLILFTMIIFSTNVYSEESLKLSGVENELIFQFEEGNLYGNITYPKAHDINTPIVIIISDLGNFDRNGKINTDKDNYYKKLAYQLSNHGIITLRYDKRGIAKSAELINNKTPSISQHKEDLFHIIDYIKKNMGRKDEKIFLLGHSEGSLVVSSTAQQRNFAGLIFYSLQPLKQKEIIKERLKKDNKELLNKGLLNDEDILVDTFNDLLFSLENDKEFSIKNENIPNRYKNLFLSLYYQKEYSKELLNLNPIELIDNQNSSALIINGKDDQILTTRGINKLLEYESKDKIQFNYLDGLNHFLLDSKVLVDSQVLDLTIRFIYNNI